LWEVLNETTDLKAMLMEVSFPNHLQKLAKVSGHHTPQSLARDMRKLERSKELPVLLYHIKPSFQTMVERECARLPKLNLTVCALGDHFIL
jgi:3',5'-cyclic-nucleotide phosphodiesterase